MNAPIINTDRAAQLARAYAIPHAVAHEIAIWPDYSDLSGLVQHLLMLGYSISEIGAVALDAAIDEACAQRTADTFTTLGEAAASVVSRIIPST